MTSLMHYFPKHQIELKLYGQKWRDVFIYFAVGVLLSCGSVLAMSESIPNFIDEFR